MKVRITGGEPLLRKGIEDLVRMLGSINNLNRVDMTTNGWFLAEKAKDLQKAGLQGVTVSLHSLRTDLNQTDLKGSQVRTQFYLKF